MQWKHPTTKKAGLAARQPQVGVAVGLRNRVRVRLPSELCAPARAAARILSSAESKLRPTFARESGQNKRSERQHPPVLGVCAGMLGWLHLRPVPSAAGPADPSPATTSVPARTYPCRPAAGSSRPCGSLASSHQVYSAVADRLAEQQTLRVTTDHPRVRPSPALRL
jgi:hypothetical protein